MHTEIIVVAPQSPENIRAGVPPPQRGLCMRVMNLTEGDTDSVPFRDLTAEGLVEEGEPGTGAGAGAGKSVEELDDADLLDVFPMEVKNNQLRNVGISVTDVISNFDILGEEVLVRHKVKLQFNAPLPFTRGGFSTKPGKALAIFDKQQRQALQFNVSKTDPNLTLVMLPRGSVLGLPLGTLRYLANMFRGGVPQAATSSFVPTGGLHVHIFNARRNIAQIGLLSVTLRPVLPGKRLVSTGVADNPGVSRGSDPIVQFDNGVAGTPVGTRVLFMLTGDAVFGLFGSFTSVYIEVNPECMRRLADTFVPLSHSLTSHRVMLRMAEAAALARPTLVACLSTGVLKEGRRGKAPQAMQRLAAGLTGFRAARTQPLVFRGLWSDVVRHVTRHEIVRALSDLCLRVTADGNVEVIPTSLEVSGRARIGGGGGSAAASATDMFHLDTRFVLCIEDANGETLMSLLPVDDFDAEGANLLLASWDKDRFSLAGIPYTYLADAANTPMATRLLPPVHSAACELMTIEGSRTHKTPHREKMMAHYVRHVLALARLTQVGVLNNCMPPGYGGFLRETQLCLAEMIIMTPGISALVCLPNLSPRFMSAKGVRALIDNHGFMGFENQARYTRETTHTLVEMFQNVKTLAIDYGVSFLKSPNNWGTRTRHWAYSRMADKFSGSYVMEHDNATTSAEKSASDAREKQVAKTLAKEAMLGIGVSPESTAPVWWEYALRMQDRLFDIDNPELVELVVEAAEVEGDSENEDCLLSPRKAKWTSAMREAVSPATVVTPVKPSDKTGGGAGGPLRR